MPAFHILASVASNVNSSPNSSTFSVNPLLHRDPSAAPLIHSHAPLSHTAWLWKEGLAPIPEGYAVPRYIPAVVAVPHTPAAFAGATLTSLGVQGESAGASARISTSHGQQGSRAALLGSGGSTQVTPLAAFHHGSLSFQQCLTNSHHAALQSHNLGSHVGIMRVSLAYSLCFSFHLIFRLDRYLDQLHNQVCFRVIVFYLQVSASLLGVEIYCLLF